MHETSIMTKGRPIISRVDAYFRGEAQRAREAQEQKESEERGVSAARQQGIQRSRAAQFRQSRARQRRTVAQVEAQRNRDRRIRQARQSEAAARLRQRAQERRDARMVIEAMEANRRHAIERVVARRTNVEAREWEYLIRWRDHGSERDQWRPRSALVQDGVGPMLDAFDAAQSSAAASSAAASSAAAASGAGGFSKAFKSNGKHDSSRGTFIGRNDNSVAAAADSDSSDSSSSSSSSDDSMDSADDDDDDSEHPSDDDDDLELRDVQAARLLQRSFFGNQPLFGALRF